jgi:hypothetical protein
MERRNCLIERRSRRRKEEEGDRWEEPKEGKSTIRDRESQRDEEDAEKERREEKEILIKGKNCGGG